jgi:hypothetical protein
VAFGRSRRQERKSTALVRPVTILAPRNSFRHTTVQDSEMPQHPPCVPSTYQQNSVNMRPSTTSLSNAASTSSSGLHPDDNSNSVRMEMLNEQDRVDLQHAANVSPTSLQPDGLHSYISRPPCQIDSSSAMRPAPLHRTSTHDGSQQRSGSRLFSYRYLDDTAPLLTQAALADKDQTVASQDGAKEEGLDSMIASTSAGSLSVQVRSNGTFRWLPR